MNRLTRSLTAFFIISIYGSAAAASTHTYLIIQESITFLVYIVCLLLVIGIFKALKGGVLGTPWLFFVIGFSAAAAGGIIKLLDLFKIMIYQYDLRPVILLTTCGSAIFLLLGLYFYRRGLE